jgi:phospholipid/cholesterol/gamma-HCH transport system permease protein
VATPSDAGFSLRRTAENVGRSTVKGVESFGYGSSLLWDSLYWLFMGRRRRQVVRAAPVFLQMMEIGIRAIPIVSALSLTIGVMLALQGIDTLREFGAEHQLVLGVSLGVVREFSPLITAILVAGRSGSALAARLGTMTISNEIDALRVMGVNPVRFLVVPSLVAMVIMLPILTIWSDFLALLGAGVFASAEIGSSLSVWFDGVARSLDVDDVLHGIEKSAIFAVLITIVGVVNGATVTGGAEGVGRVTTSSVVQGITAIVLTDALFIFLVTR